MKLEKKFNEAMGDNSINFKEHDNVNFIAQRNNKVEIIEK